MDREAMRKYYRTHKKKFEVLFLLFTKDDLLQNDPVMLRARTIAELKLEEEEISYRSLWNWLNRHRKNALASSKQSAYAASSSSSPLPATAIESQQKGKEKFKFTDPLAQTAPTSGLISLIE